MPIEIRELVIKARVEESPSSRSGSNTSEKQQSNERDLQKIINMCVEEVMKIIKRQKER
jgi:hypothetical protein